MTLLVCGDSFSEFSGYRNHMVNAYNYPAHMGGSHDIEFKHWCELLADELGIPAVSHGIGGAGISSSCFVAMQQLINSDDYTGVVFFVSHHLRSITNKVVSHQDWHNHIAKYAIIENESPLASVYNTDYYKYYSVYYFREEDENQQPILTTHPAVHHSNLQDVLDPNAMRLNIHLTEEELNFLMQKAGYSYIHDGITSVLALKAFCDSKKIPIVFASCFAAGVCDAINDIGVDFKHFKFYEVETKHNFAVRNDFPSHYNAEEHQLIYEHFKAEYPDYLKMFQKSQQQ